MWSALAGFMLAKFLREFIFSVGLRTLLIMERAEVLRLRERSWWKEELELPEVIYKISLQERQPTKPSSDLRTRWDTWIKEPVKH
ncbi:hypothetical protein RJ641_030950 [Dillenia turbinata]|uniref:Uncharacterized protein n=1 Tax=Dillenia turbinata TaxID=194707 RepID=A0AAN8ZH21_9MAGN